MKDLIALWNYLVSLVYQASGDGPGEADNSQMLSMMSPQKIGDFTRTMTGSKHFKDSEFRCKDGTDVPEELLGNLHDLQCRYLEPIREALNMPMVIISGYRTVQYNRDCGGKAASKHLGAGACDFTVPGMEIKAVAKVVFGLADAGIIPPGGIEVYEDQGFLHVDNRGVKARWEGK